MTTVDQSFSLCYVHIILSLIFNGCEGIAVVQFETVCIIIATALADNW